LQNWNPNALLKPFGWSTLHFMGQNLQNLRVIWVPLSNLPPIPGMITPRCLLDNHLYNHHPFKANFQGGPYQNVKLVAERPPGVVFVGRGFKIPSKCKLTFSRPSSKTP